MKKLMIFLCLIASSYGFSDIVSIDSILETDPYTRQDGETLVVFDIDDTLTILSESAYQRANFKTHHAGTFQEIMATLSQEEKSLAFTIPLLISSSDLIENETPLFIKDLQMRSIRTIALTAAPGGTIMGASIEDRRIEELNRVGIDFSNSFVDLLEYTFTGFKEPLIGSVPIFKKGVILTNENDKGEVLVEFLNNIDWKPDRILFVDDRMDHLLSVERSLAFSYPETHYIGFHYKVDQALYKLTDRDNFSKQWGIAIEMAKRITEEK